MYTYHICVYTAHTYTNDSKEKEAMDLRWNEGGLGKTGGRRHRRDWWEERDGEREI